MVLWITVKTTEYSVTRIRATSIWDAMIKARRYGGEIRTSSGALVVNPWPR